jgi:hypothetical protein
LSDRIEEFRRDWIADGDSYPQAHGRKKVSTHRSPSSVFGTFLLVFFGVSLTYGVVVYRRELSRWIDNEIIYLKTRTEMSTVSRLILQHHRANGTLPTDYKEYLEGNMKKNKPTGAATDFWGTPYHISSADKVVTIVSAGQDRKFGTRDDLVIESELASP